MSATLCPVCYGKGWVDKDFYKHPLEKSSTSDAALTTVCRSCNGAGYVWNKETIDFGDISCGNAEIYPSKVNYSQNAEELWDKVEKAEQAIADAKKRLTEKK